MISKGLHYTNDFPLRDAGEAQFKVSRENGEIVTRSVHWSQRQHTILIRHGLREPIKFYGVTQTAHGNLIAMSDGHYTRYYWTTMTGRRDTYVLQGSSATFEEAWEHLFEALVLDGRMPSIGLYNRISFLFIWYFNQIEEQPVVRATEGFWRGVKKQVLFEWLPEIGKRAVKVTIAGSQPVAVPLADHPLVGLLRK
jgi:hypothetical protein